MNPFRKILVPVDFSDHSEHAVEVAADMARRYGATMTLVHVHQPVLYALPDSFILYPSEQLEGVLVVFREKLEAMKRALYADGAMRIDTQVLVGIPVSSIVEHTKANQYDLIVMGTHGRTGVSHALIGSVAERVVRKATCPVLTVRLTDGKASAAPAAKEA
ncbi:MAG TPA: universal stress protein [Polyangiales bacterium]|jgi:nucleotide-binding universal stress UspA family protein|nr:universal stress protein [Polyangiales bacterium]